MEMDSKSIRLGIAAALILIAFVVGIVLMDDGTPSIHRAPQGAFVTAEDGEIYLVKKWVTSNVIQLAGPGPQSRKDYKILKRPALNPELPKIKHVLRKGEPGWEEMGAWFFLQ